MPKAVLRGGRIVPVEPLPPEWREGQELLLEALPGSDDELDDTGAWIQDIEAAASAIPRESEPAFLEAIHSIREEAKLQARREMGATG